MMKARSQFLPKAAAGLDANGNQQSANHLFRSPTSPIQDAGATLGGMASWEPDFWSKLRNATRAQIYRAEEMAAQYASARLSIQAELASDYFTLRALDAELAVYRMSIDYYQSSLTIVHEQFKEQIAAALDVARAEYQLSNAQARQLGIQAKREVTEHAIAALVNRVPASFTVDAVDALTIAEFKVPAKLPSTLLERRPDVAAMEREMAQANRNIGIARAAFYPNITFSASGGIEGHLSDLFQLANGFWSYGSLIEIPLFQGGYRRAQLQQAWSAYRETENNYRSTVLNAFREVEDGLSLTNLLAGEVERQDAAVASAVKQQDLSMELYKGGLASSLDLISSQVNTLEARITLVETKAELLRSQVLLIRSLGGGFNRTDLPKDDDIQPFDILQYNGLDKPKPAGGIDVQTEHRERNNDLTKPAARR
jgi:NodT family efflux transporter outer membrane factor (OMF) lipoprotein